MFLTTAPYQQYFDADGSPLDAGFVYFGQPNQNPETVPISVYWDEAGTQPAAQPVVTLNGYTVRAGTPAALFSAGDYSVTVKNRRGSLVAYNPSTATFISQLANQTDPAKGSALVGYLPPLTGAVGRTVSSKLRDRISVKDFGAVGDGVTDDSAAFTAALAVAAPLVVYVPTGNYLIKNVVVPTHKTIEGNGAIFKPATGAAYMFKMNGFAPSIRNCYFDGSNGNLVSVLGTNGAVVVEDATYPVVENCTFVNVNTGLCIRVSVVNASNQTTKGFFSQLIFDTITVRGIYVGPNVNTCTFSQIRMYVGVEMPDNRPRRGCIGFQMVSTGSLIAFGGHMLDLIDIEQAESGFQFTGVQLTQVTNCFADSLANAGFQCTGACQFVKFLGCLAGTSLIGFDIDGTSSDIYIDSATTILNGVVPPWWVGPGAFYLPGAPFDITAKSTAVVSVGSWFGDNKIYADAGAVLKFEGGDYMQSATTVNVPAATTAYFGPAGLNAVEFTWLAPRDGVLFSLDVASNAAPGAGQSFTYTARVEIADTGLTFTVLNAFVGGASHAPVVFTRGQRISVKLVTSAGAAATQHRITLSAKYVR